MVTPEETTTSASNQDDKRGSDSTFAAFLYEEFLTYLSGDPPPLNVNLKRLSATPGRR